MNKQAHREKRQMNENQQKTTDSRNRFTKTLDIKIVRHVLQNELENSCKGQENMKSDLVASKQNQVE